MEYLARIFSRGVERFYQVPNYDKVTHKESIRDPRNLNASIDKPVPEFQ